jgi:hypothetical protein
LEEGDEPAGEARDKRLNTLFPAMVADGAKSYFNPTTV